jgi:8-oxo-dGTP diphosphatase
MINISGCIILNQKGEVLLLHRHTSNKKQWETPGGKIEDGESPEEAAIRETEEELGVKVTIIRLLNTGDFEENGKKYHYYWHLAEISSGTPTIIETNTFDQLAYYSWNELECMLDQLSPNTKNLVHAYKNGTLVI